VSDIIIVDLVLCWENISNGLQKQT